MASNNAHRIISVLMKAKNGVSRKAIADQLNVTRALVTQQTGALLAQGMVEEAGAVETGKVGRKEILLRLTDDAGFVLGLDITLTDAAVSVLNMRSDIVFYEELTYQALDAQVQETILDLVSRQYLAYKDRGLLGTTILVQGYIKDGQSKTMQIDPLIDRVRQVVGGQCLLQNNVRAMVTVEQYTEDLPPDFLLLKYGPGVGGAIVTNGQLILGASGAAGEIGHIDWQQGEGRHCPVCGKRGCLESVVAYAAIKQQATGKPCSRASFQEMLEASKQDGNRALNQAMDEMARATSMMVQLLDPTLLYLAGELFIHRQRFSDFVERLYQHGCSRERLEVKSISDYRIKRKKAAGITMLDHYIRNGRQTA